MTAFYSGLPRELIEAARIDGAKLLQVWWHVMLPLGMPALITLGILNTLYCWNDVLIRSCVLQKKRTLMVGIAALKGEYTDQYRSSPPASSSRRCRSSSSTSSSSAASSPASRWAQ